MKLSLKMIDSPAITGGVGLALVNEDDELLPNQISTITETGVGDTVTVNVTFLVDGRNIKIG